MDINLTPYFSVIFVAVGLFGLIVGSFLSVVVSRYPKMLQQQWQTDCREFLGLPAEAIDEKISLALPRSHCRHCKNRLKFYHNIPLLSYLFLKGQCAFCQRPITALYPTIEALTCLLSLAVFWRFGLTWQMPAALLFTYALLSACFIDFQHQLLPDNITLSTLWLGLLLNAFALFTSLDHAVWAAAIGYSILWLSAWLFLHLRHKQGMGHGDFKMMAMVGAWLGLYGMLNTLLLAIVAGALLSVLLLAAKIAQWQRPIPFGPFIGIAAWITLMTHPFIIYWLRVIPA